MTSFEERLVFERKRLEFTQEAMAAIGGVQKQAQSKYENGKNHPNTLYLMAIEKVGADLTFLLTGERPITVSNFAADEQLLIDSYRTLPIAERKHMLSTLLKGGNSNSPKMINKGKGTQIKADNSKFTVNGDFNE